MGMAMRSTLASMTGIVARFVVHGLPNPKIRSGPLTAILGGLASGS